jgi:hypothetical protein
MANGASAYDNGGGSGPDGAASPNAQSSSGGSAGTPPLQGSPAAKGIVIVHSATYPAFRLCVSNHPDLQPQPDSKVMPEANLVGVEVGSVVRIDGQSALGEVFVIDEKAVQSTAGTIGTTCGKLICTGPASCLRPRDYHSAGRIDQPLGQMSVDVMAITGCGDSYDVMAVSGQQADCPTPYDPNTGNLTIQTLPLLPKQAATNASIPVELVQMSYLADKARAGADLDVKFGVLASGPSTSLAHDPALYAGGSETTLAVDQTDQTVYAQHGFRVTIGTTFSVDLSLADVQSLSSPRDVPSSYYTVASNYALLLLGDPRLKPTDPGYDPRRGMHLLAVPVLDPAELDGGTEGGDGGDR